MIAFKSKYRGWGCHLDLVVVGPAKLERDGWAARKLFHPPLSSLLGFPMLSSAYADCYKTKVSAPSRSICMSTPFRIKWWKLLLYWVVVHRVKILFAQLRKHFSWLSNFLLQFPRFIQPYWVMVVMNDWQAFASIFISCFLKKNIDSSFPKIDPNWVVLSSSLTKNGFPSFLLR